MKVERLFLVATLASMTGACGGDDTNGSGVTPGAQTTLTDRLGTLSRDLAPGMKGEDVRALHESLSQYGYFPNARLQRGYPSWRPLVSRAPADLATFDQSTSEAVRAFQGNMQLPQTGIVDEGTRRALQTPRCGVPDGLPRIDASDKYAQSGAKWPTTALTWRVLPLAPGITLNGVTLAQTHDVVRDELAVWAAQTNLTFTENTTAADIEVHYGAIDGVNGTLASTFFPQNGDMTIDPAETWSVATPTPANAFDLRTIVLHELGHSLGLTHSGFQVASMFPTVSLGSSKGLNLDDDAGISSLYDAWEQLPGLAKDIGVGANGEAWAIGTLAMGNGDFSIHKWNGSSWVGTDGGALRIAVGPTGVPWVVNSAGTIFRRTSNSPTSGSWQQLAGSAKDIAVGADGTAWKIGTTAMGTAGDFSIEKFNGTAWVAAAGGAIRIAVGPDGVPWVSNTVGTIFRRTTNSPTTGNWTQLPGQATDIGINDGNIAWSIGKTPIGGGGDFIIQTWNEQPTANLGSPPAPAEFAWIAAPGGARSVSVGPNGRPWVINNAGVIFRSQK